MLPGVVHRLTDALVDAPFPLASVIAAPAKTKSRPEKDRMVPWSVPLLIVGATCFLAAWKVYCIVSEPVAAEKVPKKDLTMHAARDWGRLPNISICPHNAFEVRWAYSESYIFNRDYEEEDVARLGGKHTADGVLNGVPIEVAPFGTGSCLRFGTSLLKPSSSDENQGVLGGENILTIKVSMRMTDPGETEVWEAIKLYARTEDGHDSFLGYAAKPDSIHGDNDQRVTVVGMRKWRKVRDGVNHDRFNAQLQTIKVGKWRLLPGFRVDCFHCIKGPLSTNSPSLSMMHLAFRIRNPNLEVIDMDARYSIKERYVPHRQALSVAGMLVAIMGIACFTVAILLCVKPPKQETENKIVPYEKLADMNNEEEKKAQDLEKQQFEGRGGMPPGGSSIPLTNSNGPPGTEMWLRPGAPLAPPASAQRVAPTQWR